MCPCKVCYPDEGDEKVNESSNKATVLSSTQHITERNWILTVIRDGLRDMLDFSILQQNFVFKILLTFFSSRNNNYWNTSKWKTKRNYRRTCGAI